MNVILVLPSKQNLLTLGGESKEVLLTGYISEHIQVISEQLSHV